MSQNPYHSPHLANYPKSQFPLFREANYSPMTNPSIMHSNSTVDDKMTNSNNSYRMWIPSPWDPKEFPSLGARHAAAAAAHMQQQTMSPLTDPSGGGGGLSGLSGGIVTAGMSPLMPNFVSAINSGGGGRDLLLSSDTMESPVSTASQNNESKEFFIEKEDFPALPSQSHSHASSALSASAAAVQDGASSRHDNTWATVPASMRSNNALSYRALVTSPSTASSGGLQHHHNNSVGHSINNNNNNNTSSSNTINSISSSSHMMMHHPTGGAGAASTAVPTSLSGNAPSSLSVGGSKMRVSADGVMENVPSTMLQDAFGLCALAMMNQANSPFLVGENMIDLYDFNKGKPGPCIYPSLLTPLRQVLPMRPQDMDWLVPEEYHIRHRFHSQLADLNLSQLRDETLFWIFYNCCGEDAQAVAGKALHNRGWRYHVERKEWLVRVPEQQTVNGPGRETGFYYVWDPILCDKVKRQYTLYHSDLDIPPDMCCEKLQVAVVNSNKPMVPAAMHGRSAVAAVMRYVPQQVSPLQQPSVQLPSTANNSNNSNSQIPL